MHLFTQAYGKDPIRAQALYLCWSALAWKGDLDLDVHVYTDDPAFFRPLADEIRVQHMGPAEVRAWRGRHDFTHRLKALLVRDMVQRYPGDKLLYLDADTYLSRSPASIFQRIGPGRSVMHAREDHVGSHPGYHMRNFSRHLRRLSFRGAPIDVDRWMWNAGVIGMDPATFPVVDRWIAFIDEVWPRYRRGLVEQYSISMLLQQAGEVAGCAEEVVHYWFQKDEYTSAIRGELEVLRTRPLGEALAHLRERPLRIPYVAKPRRRTPPWRTFLRSLFGER